MKDSFIVYRSFHLAISELNDKDRLMIYDAIFEFGLNHKETELKQLPKAMWHLIKPQLEANHRKYLNGKLGGKATKEKWAKQGQSKGKLIANVEQANSKLIANDNVNVNDNVNGNVNVGLPIKTGEFVFLDVDFIKELIKSYPHIDIHGELLKMRIWLVSNIKQRKTAKGMPRFVNNWLSKIKPSSPTDSYADIHKAVLDKKNVLKKRN